MYTIVYIVCYITSYYNWKRIKAMGIPEDKMTRVLFILLISLIRYRFIYLLYRYT